MIVRAVVGTMFDLLSKLLGAIPDVTIPGTDQISTFAVTIGGALGGLNGFLPIEEIGVFVAWTLTTYLPVRITFEVVRWVYEHMPVIGAGG